MPQNNFKIILNRSRAFGGYEQITSNADYQSWLEIDRLYSKTIIDCPDNGKIRIQIDWSSPLHAAEKDKMLFSLPKELFSKKVNDGPSHWNINLICNASVSYEGATPPSAPSYFGDKYLKKLLFEVFIIANISNPGSFNLYRSYLRVPNLDPNTSPFALTELELSEYMFETAWHDAQKSTWLNVETLSFDETFEWFKKHKILSSSIAERNIDKVIFALMHLARREFTEPEATIWAAAALEALYDSPSHGNSFQILNKRIIEFLSLDITNQKSLRKKLRAFYDERNKFAHGGGKVFHPLANEFEEDEYEKISENLLTINDFSSSLLISSIQQFIKKDIIGLKFQEVLTELKS